MCNIKTFILFIKLIITRNLDSWAPLFATMYWKVFIVAKVAKKRGPTIEIPGMEVSMFRMQLRRGPLCLTSYA